MERERRVDVIVDTICSYYGLSKEAAFENTRKQDIVLCRNMIVFYLRYDMGLTFREIGNIIQKNISTAIRGFTDVREKSSNNGELRRDCEILKKRIKDKIGSEDCA